MSELYELPMVERELVVNAVLTRSAVSGRWTLDIPPVPGEHFLGAAYLFGSGSALPPGHRVRAEALRRLHWAAVGEWEWSEDRRSDGVAELSSTVRVVPVLNIRQGRQGLADRGTIDVY